MSLQSSLDSLSKFSRSMRALPRVLAQRVTARAAPLLTEASRATFDAGEDAYGALWAPGADGKRVTLRLSGRLANTLRYVAIGTKLRVALTVPYAKYQIGRRPVFPSQGGVLPASYAKAIADATQQEAQAYLAAGSQ